MKTKTITIMCIIVGLIVAGISIHYLNYKGEIENTAVETIEQEITSESTTTSTTTTKTTKKAKKVVKTTKKKTIKKKSTKKKSKYKNFNIKYNRNEIINYTYKEVVRRWGESHWQAVYNIVSHESGFNPNSVNKSSGACGLFQAHPCNNTIKNGYKDYKTNWKTQVNWGLDYIMYRYKTPNKAWSFWQKHHWY